jgi:hypothetical protein
VIPGIPVGVVAGAPCNVASKHDAVRGSDGEQTVEEVEEGGVGSLAAASHAVVAEVGARETERSRRGMLSRRPLEPLRRRPQLADRSALMEFLLRRPAAVDG